MSGPLCTAQRPDIFSVIPLRITPTYRPIYNILLHIFCQCHLFSRILLRIEQCRRPCAVPATRFHIQEIFITCLTLNSIAAPVP